MSNHQQNLTMPTTSDFHPKDDMMSESSSTVSLSSSSYLLPRIQKLVARLASLEEEIVHTNLSEEEILTYYAICPKCHVLFNCQLNIPPNCTAKQFLSHPLSSKRNYCNIDFVVSTPHEFVYNSLKASLKHIIN